MPTKQIDIVKTKAYLIKLFDGMFTEDQLLNNRSYCFARVASYASPKTKKTVGDTLTEEDIGVVLNELSTLQFNRRLDKKAQKLSEEASF